ncbi:MAG: pitrilysin family protein [Hyphomicrobiales bacterium]|nr:pitrilysin family protein [Hyphomicrobiales bacterium]
MTVAVTKLANGLSVVTHAMPHLETATVGVSVNAGTRAELPGEHGVAHMLEHMAFKGTPTRTARDIAEQIEAVGGNLNAATSIEHTDYAARVLKADVPTALAILADILQNPSFAEEELEREREVIIQEIAAVNDAPDDMVFDMAQEAAFPRQSLGRPILGTAKSVGAIAARDLHAFRQATYAPEKMVLSAAGAVDHDAIVAQAEGLFAGLTATGDRPSQPARYVGGHKALARRFEQCNMVLAFEGLSWRDPDVFAAKVFTVLFGGGMSSRLFQEAREKRGLCYDIHAFDWSFADTGLYGVHAATGADQTSDLTRLILTEIGKMIDDGPREEEIQRAKAQLKSALLMSLESSEARVGQIARDMQAFGRPLTTEELIDRIEEVTREKVRDLAVKLHMRSPITSAAVGPRGASQAVQQLIEDSGMRAAVIH